MCKSRLALVTILIIILLSLGMLGACESEKQTQSQTPTYPEASMTADEVINIVLVYGVPEFPIYGAQPVGQWAAVYEGAGKWRIQGSVATSMRIMGETRTTYWKSTWSYANNQVKLINYSR